MIQDQSAFEEIAPDFLGGSDRREETGKCIAENAPGQTN